MAAAWWNKLNIRMMNIFVKPILIQLQSTKYTTYATVLGVLFPSQRCLLFRGRFTQSVEVSNDGLKCLIIFFRHVGPTFFWTKLIIFHQPPNSGNDIKWLDFKNSKLLRQFVSHKIHKTHILDAMSLTKYFAQMDSFGNTGKVTHGTTWNLRTLTGWNNFTALMHFEQQTSFKSVTTNK